MNLKLEEKIKKLVEIEYSSMELSKKYSNRARLSCKCQDIIYSK